MRSRTACSILLLLCAALTFFCMPYLTTAAQTSYILMKEGARPVGSFLLMILRFIFGSSDDWKTTVPENSSNAASSTSLTTCSCVWDEATYKKALAANGVTGQGLPTYGTQVLMNVINELGALPTVVAFQYNPDALTRGLEARGAKGQEGTNRGEAQRLSGPPFTNCTQG